MLNQVLQVDDCLGAARSADRTPRIRYVLAIFAINSLRDMEAHGNLASTG